MVLLVAVPASGQGPTGSTPAPVPSGASAQPAVNPQVKQLYDVGIKAAEKGQWEKARASFEEAFKLDPRPKIAVNLGNAELELGRYRDAAEHLEYFLRNDTSGNAAARQPVQQLLDKATAQIGTLRVTVDVKGAEVLVDGRSVGQAPVERPIFVEPGSYTIEARSPEKTPVSQKVALAAGAKLDVDLKLVPACVEGPKKVIEEEQPWKKPSLYGAVGLAVVGLGVGIGFSVAAAMKSGEYEDEIAYLRERTLTTEKICPGGVTDPRCRKMVELGETQNTYAYLARAGFIVGGLATAGAVAIALVKPKKTTVDETKCKNVAVTPTLGGLLVSGCF
ncbi:PEGA domain-containing protein [Polyangium jinanense]|uniref:PEGA domain-containing protein n=1 Tax=Polyangium jinanense TaxID=2829994 RepID=A0A9X3XCE1_9BACT|nr:PEGA domain-containing protein [Polyangium jinanense]MDC3960487.1 PEGA domain-containing protein [Polyangium jinanense]MDC3986740.1 PEGA domain-containing protein [Polyangium jinanense]